MKIKIINNSDLDHDTLSAYVDAIQIQLDKDFCPCYGYKAELSYDSGDYDFILENETDRKGALGYHSTYGNKPFAKIFFKDIINNSKKVSVAMSHEILELVNNPLVNRTVINGHLVYLYECCDPTQCEELGYKINNIVVSNFVTPYWFDVTSKDTRFDFCNRVEKPFQVLRRCYACITHAPFKKWFRIDQNGISYKDI